MASSCVNSGSWSKCLHNLYNKPKVHVEVRFTHFDLKDLSTSFQNCGDPSVYFVYVVFVSLCRRQACGENGYAVGPSVLEQLPAQGAG